jgi:hypothetical protein
MALVMYEQGNGTRWEFSFIYYNNAYFGGTRDEYRLTRMTKYLRSINAKVADELVFSRNSDYSYVVNLRRSGGTIREPSNDNVLVLSGGWKVVDAAQLK